MLLGKGFPIMHVYQFPLFRFNEIFTRILTFVFFSKLPDRPNEALLAAAKAGDFKMVSVENQNFNFISE